MNRKQFLILGCTVKGTRSADCFGQSKYSTNTSRTRILATVVQRNIPYLFFNNFLSFLQSNRLLIYFNLEHVPYYTNDIINHT